jgi:hypothetical protein
MFELIRISRALLASAVKSGTWGKVGPLLAELGRSITVHADALHHDDANPNPAALRRLMASATPTIDGDLDAAFGDLDAAREKFGGRDDGGGPAGAVAPGAETDPAKIDPATVLAIIQLVTQVIDAIRRRRQAALGMTSTAPPELGEGEGNAGELGQSPAAADRPELTDPADVRAARAADQAKEAHGNAGT